MYNYPLKYRSYNQLLDEILMDLPKYTMENMINPEQLIKIAKKVNYDLGLRIMMTKETILDVERNKVKLPDDFYTFNYGVICDETTVIQQMPQGTHIAEVQLTPNYIEIPELTDACTPPVVNCGSTYVSCGCSSGCNSGCSCGCHSSANYCATQGDVYDSPESTSETSTDQHTETTTVTTRSCCWTYPINKAYRSFTITVDDNPYSILCETGLNQIMSDLNSRGWGTFTYTSDKVNITICTDGENDFGPIVVNGDPYSGTVYPECNITTTVTTTVTNEVTNDTRVTQRYHPPTSPCVKPRVFTNCVGDCYEVVQIVNPATSYTYSRFLPLKLIENAESIECGCPNLYLRDGTNTAWIKDGFLETNFTCGKVYISYQAVLVNDEGDIMVPDHDGLNEYYEYALKDRVFENLYFMDETVLPKLQWIQVKLKEARKNAKTLVNTPNFNEMKRMWLANRKAQYYKYYDMFKSYSWYQRTWNNNLDVAINPTT